MKTPFSILTLIVVLMILFPSAVRLHDAAYALSHHKAGSHVKDRRHSSASDMEFIFVKGGCYKMGDIFGDGNSDEKPVHEVCVSDFYMGKYLVTQGQWKDIMGYDPSLFSSCGENCPVENVSWSDTQVFIGKLNGKTGKNYRLPTEAEWEYAARSGGRQEKWAGTSSELELQQYAWYDRNSGDKTHPVGQKKPNGLGLYDMSGNVWEWCQDWFDDSYYRDGPRNNPTGPGSGQDKMLRGGSWFNGRNYVRAETRFGFDPASPYILGGFRLVAPSGR